LVSLGNSSSYPLALASRTLWLVGYRIAFIAVFTSMAIVTPAPYRSRTMGVLGALAAFASVIGAPLGTRLAGSLGWRNGIFGYAAIAIVGGFLFSLLYRRQANGKQYIVVAIGNRTFPAELVALALP